MSDTVIGSCKHGKALHFGFPCADCEADVVVDRIQDEMRAGFTPENGLYPRIHRLIRATVAEAVERVQRYKGTGESR